MLKNISVVLVETKGPLNIGMVARAMKNFGVARLKLVKPASYKRAEAVHMACFAKDVVDNAEVFDSLEGALADEVCSVAFARRTSKDRLPYYDLEKIAPSLVKKASKGNLALVFGRETDGLTNEEIFQCDYRVYVRACEPFGSLNLAQAVFVACYEVFKNTPSGCEKGERIEELFASQKEVKPMLQSFERLLLEIGYDDKDDSKLRKKIVRAFKDICGRSGLRKKDVNMFLGIWSQIRKNLGHV